MFPIFVLFFQMEGFFFDDERQFDLAEVTIRALRRDLDLRRRSHTNRGTQVKTIKELSH